MTRQALALALLLASFASGCAGRPASEEWTAELTVADFTSTRAYPLAEYERHLHAADSMTFRSRMEGIDRVLPPELLEPFDEGTRQRLKDHADYIAGQPDETGSYRPVVVIEGAQLHAFFADHTRTREPEHFLFLGEPDEKKRYIHTVTEDRVSLDLGTLLPPEVFPNYRFVFWPHKNLAINLYAVPYADEEIDASLPAFVLGIESMQGHLFLQATKVVIQ